MPVVNAAVAKLGPTLRTTYGEITAGRIPSRTSVNANVAASTVTAMSAIATRPAPPPMAGPCTRAMIGIGRASSAA